MESKERQLEGEKRRWGRSHLLLLGACVLAVGGGVWWSDDGDGKEVPTAADAATAREPARPRPRPASQPAPRRRAGPSAAERRLRKQRIRDVLFSGEFALRRFPRKYRKLVEYKIQEFLHACEEGERCVKDQLEQALKRAGPSLAQVRKMLKDAGVPPILLYLNFAESLWKRDIRSRAGAYGVCQFMPNTAKWLGFLLHGPFAYYRDCSSRVLRRTPKGRLVFARQEKIRIYRDMYLYDQRRDLFVSIAKKIEYLKALKRRYVGNSWILAAFRYNFGPGNVSRIMSRVVEDFERLPRSKRKLSKLIWMFLRSNRNQENYHYVANIMAFAHILSGLEVDRPEWVKARPLVAVPFRAPVVMKKVALRRGETISKIASRHRVTVRAVLKATGLSVAQAARLPIGAPIKVPAPKSLFVTPYMLRKHLGVGLVFYDWNPGIHDPRTRIKEVNYRYTFLYRARAGESFASIARRFKHRRVRLRQLLRANLSARARRKARRKRGKVPVKAGTLLKVTGAMRFRRRRSRSALATADQRRKVERAMPPIPGGWILYVPPHLAGKLKAFLKKKIAAYTP